MPLPPAPAERRPIHQRRITVQSFARDDGLWDIEGELQDTLPEDLVMASGRLLPANQPMHAMTLRLTVDRTATVVAAEAVTDAGPYGAACGAITPDYGQLVGARIARGWRETVRRLFGRTAGCTHINELAGVMGSAALQALWNELATDPEVQPFSIDGCHALKSSGPQVAAYFPRWYRPLPAAAADQAPQAGAAPGA